VDSASVPPPQEPAPGSPVTAGALDLDPARVPVLAEAASCPDGQAVAREGAGWACVPLPAAAAHDHDDRYLTPEALETRLAGADTALPWTALTDPDPAGCPAGGVLQRDAADDGWTCQAVDLEAAARDAAVDLELALANGSAAVGWGDLAGLPAGVADGDGDVLAALPCGPGQVPSWLGGGWACADDEDTRYDGSHFVPSAQSCAEAGTFSTGADAAGALVCAPPPAPDLDALAVRAADLEALVAGLCARRCDGRTCGADGCGGTCGDCAAWERCAPAGRCDPVVAVPAGWVLVRPGTFTMGSPEGEPVRHEGEVRHEVTLTRPYLLKATEVTQDEWLAVMGATNTLYTACGGDCPVEHVTWYEAVAFCNGLSAAHGLDPCYLTAGNAEYGPADAATHAEVRWPDGLSCPGFRLPTEAEWEHAARAGTAGPLHSGEELVILGDRPDQSCDAPALHPLAWYAGNSGVDWEGGRPCDAWADVQIRAEHCGPAPVGLKRDNPWGLADVLGNVAEWVWDVYDLYPEDEAGQPLDATDPLGPAQGGGGRLFRGCGWDHAASRCRAAWRGARQPVDRARNLGLRPARTVVVPGDP